MPLAASTLMKRRGKSVGCAACGELISPSRSVTHRTAAYGAPGTSAARGSLQGLRIAGALDLDLRGGRFDPGEVTGRELDRGSPDVLLQACRLGGSRDGDDPRLLGQQPSERDLRRRRALLPGNLGEEVDEGLVGLAGNRG